MRRRHQRGIPHEEEKTERWLVSYADFITLLFAFFVVMYSISSVNQGKYRVLSDSMTEAFNRQSVMAVKPAEQLGVSVQRAPIAIGRENQSGTKVMKETAAQIENRMKNWIKKGQIAVRGNEKWLEVEINTSVLFASGSAELSQPASKILGELAESFKTSNNPIYVSGYTDDQPINTLKYPSNWELSAARSASVVRLLSQAGIDPGRLGAIGFAEFRPVADNTSDENRQKNRRVIIRILTGEDMFSDSTPLQPPAQAAQSLQNELQINSLQPGEPARAFQ
jgi:chemotaxis protein MotB